MDTELLDQSLSFHGSALMQQLMEEHGEALSLPAVVRRRFSASDSPVKDRWMAEDKSDPQFMTAVQKFIARKADMLFHPARKKGGTRDTADSDQPEDVFGIMPPLESFMGVPPDYCQEYFYESLCVGDLVVGVVVSVSDSGIIASLLCTETPGLHRDIDELDISAFCPAKELPRMFAHQSVTEAYHPRDVFRGCVIGVNPDKKRIFVSLKDRSSSDQKEDLPKIGLISKDDFPVHYRRKLERCGLTFGQLLQSVLGFTNKGSVDTLQVSLGLDSAASLMRGLHGAKIPDEEYAERLRKWQTNKQAHSSVVAGVELVKKGRQLEAIQHLNMALKIDPGHTEALVARGAVYANNASYLKAIEDFQKALESDPKHVNAKKYLVETKIACARRHEEEGSVEDAVEYYRDVMKTDPSSMEAKQGYERCRHRQGEEESSKGHKSADVVSVSSSEEGGDIQKSADKLLRLMKAEKKKKRKSGDVSPPSSSKKSKHKKERRKSKHQSDSPSSSSSSSSSRSSSPQRDSPHTKLNRLWEEFQSQGKQPTRKGRPHRSAFSRSASRNRSRSKSSISSSSSNSLSRSRSGSGVKAGRLNEGGKAADTSNLSNKWDDLSTYIGGASKHYQQILAGVNQRRRDSGGRRRSSGNSESADSGRDRRRSRGRGRDGRDSWRSGDRSFSPGGRRDKHRRGSGQSRERSKYRRDERRESRSDRDGDRRRSRDSRESKGKKDRRKSGEGKKRKHRKKSRDSKKKLKGHNSKRDKDVKQEDESEIWVEATKEYTGKNSKESTIHVGKEDGPEKVQLKETDEERTLKAQHADSRVDKGQQHSQVRALDSPQHQGSEKDVGGSIKHGVDDEHESQRGREVKRKTYPAVEDPPIIERKGTLTVASKWDSPTRRSRWDTTKDGNDSMVLAHMAMRDENTKSQSSQELQKNQLQGELTQPRGEGIGGGDKDESSNQHDSQSRQLFGETYSKWSRGRDFDKHEDSPDYNVTGKWTETGISVSSRGEGDTERDVSREASTRWPQEKSAQRGSGAELSSQQSGAESDVRRFKEGPHGGTDEDLHDRLDKGERGKSSTKEMFKLASWNMEAEESKGSSVEKTQEEKAKEIRELLHQHLTLQDLEFPNLSTKQLQQRLYQEIAAHISATNSPATTTDGSRSTRLTDPRVAEGEKSPEGRSQREGKGRLDVSSNDAGSGRKEKAEAGDGVDVSAHLRPEKKEDTHGRGTWKRKEASSDDSPPHHADQREREEESPERRKDRKSKMDTSREREKSSRTERRGRHRSPDKEKRSRRDKSGYGRAEDSGTSLWVEKIVSNVDVKPAEKINPGDVDIKFLFRTSSGTVDSSFTRQLVPGNLSSSTSKSLRRSQSPSSVERDSSSTKKRRSSSQKEYGNGRSRSKKKKRSASSSSSSSSDRRKDKKRSSAQRRKRHRSTSSSSSTSDDDGRQVMGSSQKAKRRKRSASSSSSSSSSDVQRKKKYSSSQQAKNKKTVKSSKKVKQYSSSSFSSSSSPPPVKRRTSQGEKTASARVQSRHEVYRQDVVKQERQKPCVKATVAPHTVIQKVETAQPSDSKLNELEDFLKELKSKKKEKQIAEGRAKKT